MSDFEFVYVGDPMCSWCWGFAPVLDRLAATFTIPIRLVVGGLRPGDSAQVLDDRLRGYLGHHWRQVQAQSGQPFDFSFLDRSDGWLYDTETADTAVVTMRELNPDEALRFFVTVQRAFYADGVDVTDPAIYPSLLDGFAVDPDVFMSAFRSGEMKARTWADFDEARHLGVSGFPTLLLDEGEQMVVAAPGYVDGDRLIPAISDWLETKHADVAPGLMCDLDGDVC